MLKSYVKNIENKITLSGVASDPRWVDHTIKALLYSKRLTGIKNAQLISCESFGHPEIKCIIVEKIKTWEDYNYFLLKEYDQYINTQFLLTIHDDGFVLNPSLWLDEFLEYDFVGAMWPWDCLCCNGGFSLRSKKLLHIAAKYCPYHHGINEDLIIACRERDLFLSHGIKFPPLNLAAKFSIEHPTAETNGQSAWAGNNLNSFGFHGAKTYYATLKDSIDLW